MREMGMSWKSPMDVAPEDVVDVLRARILVMRQAV